MKRLMIAMAALIAMSGVAQAQDFKPYAGFGIGGFGVEEKEPGFSQKSTTFGGYGKLGVDVNDYLGGELRFGATGNGSQTYAAGTTFGGIVIPVPVDVTLTSDYFISYLAKLQLPVAEDFRVSALLGATTAKIKGTASAGVISASTSATKTGFSYGFGGEYFFNSNMSVGGEWIQYLTDVNLDSVSTARLWGASGTFNFYF